MTSQITEDTQTSAAPRNRDVRGNSIRFLQWFYAQIPGFICKFIIKVKFFFLLVRTFHLWPHALGKQQKALTKQRRFFWKR